MSNHDMIKSLIDKKKLKVMKRTDMENIFYPIFTRGRGSTKTKKVVYDKANSTKGNNGHEYILNVTPTDDHTQQKLSSLSSKDVSSLYAIKTMQ